MLQLYPKIKPNKEYKFKVDNIHEIYVAEYGTERGIPVICCHGGPGGETIRSEVRLFDPEFYRIIAFDQRGCGKSTPYNCVKNNTTQLLISDIELIRNKLDIEKWIIAGGGWGSTLALLYAEAHPDVVARMLLWSICLLRRRDLSWIYVDGANRFFPEHWRKLGKALTKDERKSDRDMLEIFYDKLLGKDDFARINVAKAWSYWESHCATLHLNNDVVHYFREPHIALNLALMSCHYFVNNVFIEENQILNNIEKIAKIPTKIIHGRYDMLSPLENADMLHRKLPFSELQIIREAGHAFVEAGIIDALIRSTREILRELGYNDLTIL